MLITAFGLIAAEVGDREAIDPVLSRLMFEAMREAERNPHCGSGWGRCSPSTAS
jgi:hypothetical protein